jgi:hypothetical protein
MRGNRRGARRILAGGMLRVLLVVAAFGVAYLTVLAPAAAAGPCHVVTSSDLGTKSIGEAVTVSQSGPQGGSFSSYSGSISWGDGATTAISGGVGSWSHTYSSPGTYSIRTTGSGAYGPPTTSCSDDITQTVRIVAASPPDGGGKTTCRKNGHRVLCPGQRKVVNKVVGLSKKTVKVTAGFKKAGPQKQSNKLLELTRQSRRAEVLKQLWRNEDLPRPSRTPIADLKEFDRFLALDYVYINNLDAFNEYLANVADDNYVHESPGHLAQVALDEATAKLFPGRTYPDLVANEKAAVYAAAYPSDYIEKKRAKDRVFKLEAYAQTTPGAHTGSGGG